MIKSFCIWIVIITGVFIGRSILRSSSVISHKKYLTDGVPKVVDIDFFRWLEIYKGINECLGVCFRFFFGGGSINIRFRNRKKDMEYDTKMNLLMSAYFSKLNHCSKLKAWVTMPLAEIATTHTESKINSNLTPMAWINPFSGTLQKKCW